MRVLQSIPYLRVRDMQRSIAFYVDGLGFELKDSSTAEDGLFWASLSLDACQLMLSHRPSRFLADGHPEDDHEHDDQGRHVFNLQASQNGELNFVTYLYVDDVDATYEELLSSSASRPIDRAARQVLRRPRVPRSTTPDGYYYAIAQRRG